MWSPPFIILPFDCGWENVLEAQRQFDMRFASGMFPWHLIHMRPCAAHLISQGKQVQAAILSNEEAKKLILKRSVFELVKKTQFLELTDSKLLGWYLCLPAEDRKLVQEEGGLLQFLQKHPALDVTRNFVYVTRQSLEEFTYPLSSAMSTDLNRQHISCGVSLCKSCGASIPFITKACKLCCAHTKNPDEKLCLQDPGKELGLLPTSVKEELNFGTARAPDSPAEHQTAQISADKSLNLMTEESFCSACEGTTATTPTGHQGAQCSQAHILSQLWDEQVDSKSSVVTMYKDLSAQASFALDAHLERHSKVPPTVEGGQEQGRCRGDGTADLPEAEIIPEYYSLDSTGLGTSYRDCSENSQSGGSFNSEPVQVHECHVARQADGCSSAGSAPCCGSCTEWKPSSAVDDYNEEEDSSGSLKNEEFHSLMGEESPEIRGGAAWVSSWSPTVRSAEMDTQLNPSAEHYFACSPTDTSGSFSSTAAMYDSTSVVESPQFATSQSVDVSRDFRACYTSTRATEAKSSTANKFSNTELSYTTRNASMNTGCPVPLQDRGIQTISVSTAEKSVITEVYMADLDCFIEEFDKLQHTQDELEELKAKLLRPEAEESDGSGREGHTCDCSQRAVRAELRLLALQYAMCQQHCWRRYYTSPEGEFSILSMEAPTENIKSLLLDLEKDYCEMKGKILSGVPLDRLCALSVNSQRTGSDAAYIPFQIAQDSLSEEEASGTGLGGPELGPQDGGESEGADSVGQNCTEPMQSDAPPALKPRLKCVGADVLHPQQTAPSTGPAVGTKPGGAKDLETSEAWYDAEEELGSAAKGLKGTQNEAVEGIAGAVSEGKKDLNCLLCVSGLPSHLTEEEVRSHFRKYQVSEVNITTFSSDISVAIMTVSCPKMAEAAVRETNRGTIKGHAVKVTLVGRPVNLLAEGPRGQRAKPNSCRIAKAESAENTKGPSNSKSCLSIAAKPIQRRLEKLTNVQDTPTATGTCVPRHYATMGSFQTLMARLTERHPEAGRERIVRALVDLREQKQSLCGLPLKDIVEMTSDLLTRSAQ